jgi:hypothetical protein
VLLDLLVFQIYIYLKKKIFFYLMNLDELIQFENI